MRSTYETILGRGYPTAMFGTSPDIGALEPTGPFIQAALVCEKVLQESNGVISAIRIVDRIIFICGPDGQPLVQREPIFFLIAFKSGEARGSHPVEIIREEPSTTRTTVVQAQMFFEGEDRGANLVVQAAFEPAEPGLYWFDVRVNDRLLTRIPLRAIYQTPPTAGPPG